MLVVPKIIIIILMCTRENARFGLSVVIFFNLPTWRWGSDQRFKKNRENGLGRHNGLL